MDGIRLTAAMLKNSRPSRLVPVDRSNRSLDLKKKVKGIRFTNSK